MLTEAVAQASAAQAAVAQAAVAQASAAQASAAQEGGEGVGVLEVLLALAALLALALAITLTLALTLTLTLTLEVLLALCHALRIDINRMAVKSDSRTTALHRAPDLGARVRVRVRGGFRVSS